MLKHYSVLALSTCWIQNAKANNNTLPFTEGLYDFICIHTCLSKKCNEMNVPLTPACAEGPLVSCCCVYCNECLFLLTFLHTNAVQTINTPPWKTKSKEATIAAIRLPSSVVESCSFCVGMGVMTTISDVRFSSDEVRVMIPLDSEAVDSILNDVLTGSAAKANQRYTYIVCILAHTFALT